MQRYLSLGAKGCSPSTYLRVDYAYGYADVEVLRGQFLYVRNLPLILEHIGFKPAAREEAVYLLRRRGMSGAIDYTIGTVEVPGRTWADDVSRTHVSMYGKVRRVTLAGAGASVLLAALKEDWGSPDPDLEVRDFTPLPLKTGVRFYPAEESGEEEIILLEDA